MKKPTTDQDLYASIMTALPEVEIGDVSQDSIERFSVDTQQIEAKY